MPLRAPAAFVKRRLLPLFTPYLLPPFAYIVFVAHRVLADLACDAALNVRAIQPALLAYQYNKLTPEVAAKFSERLGKWLETWIAAAGQDECGKPKFVLPSVLRFPSGAPGGPASSTWQDGGCKIACMELKSERAFLKSKKVCASHTDTFNWPTSVENLAVVMVLASVMNSDCRYLEVLKNARLLSEEDQDKYSTRMSIAYAKHFMMSNGQDVLFTDEIERLGYGGYVDMMLSASYATLDFGKSRAEHWADVADLAKEEANKFAINFEGYTSEARFTDRMWKFHKVSLLPYTCVNKAAACPHSHLWPIANKLRRHFVRTCGGEPLCSHRLPPLFTPMRGPAQFAAKNKFSGYKGASGQTFYSMISGDVGDPYYATLQAVSYRGTDGGGDMAGLVVVNRMDRFESVLWNGREERTVQVVLKRLEAGAYWWGVVGISEVRHSIRAPHTCALGSF